MDAWKVKIFTEFCIYLGMYGYLDLDNNGLLCFYEECLVMGEYLRNISNTAHFNLLNKVGDLHQQMNQFSKALHFFNKAIRFAIKIGNKKCEALAMRSAGNVLRSLCKYQEAIEYYNKSLNIALEISNKNIEVAAYGNLGNVYESLGKYMEAIKHHEKSLNIALELGDKSIEGAAYNNLGTVYTKLGKYMEAIKHHEKSLNIALKIGDKSREGAAYGNLGNVYKSLGKYMEATKHYEKSLNIALELGYKSREGAAYGNLGNVYKSLGKYMEAIEHYEKSLNIALETGDKSKEGTAYGNLGNVYRSLGKYMEAIKHHQKSLNIALELGEKSREGAAYGSLGNVYQSLGKYMEAIKHYEKSLNIALELGDKSGEGAAYGNLGGVYQSLGKYREAIKHQEKSLNIALKIGDKTREGAAYGNLGNVYLSLGKYMEAIKHHEKSLNIALETGDKSKEGATYDNLGNVYLSLGKYMEAIEHHEKRLHIALETGDKSSEGAVYGNLGNVYQSLGKYMEAIKHYEKSLNIALELRDKTREGTAYGNLGAVYAKLGKYMEAIKHNEQSLNIALELGDKSVEATSYCRLGGVFYSLGKYQEALEYHEKGLRIAKEIGSKNIEGQVNLSFGLLYYNLDDGESCKNNQELSIHYLKESVRCWDYVFEHSHEQDDSKISIVDTFIDAYKLLTKVLIETNQTEEALLVCDRGRARALGDILTSKYGIDKEYPLRSTTLEYNDVKKMLSRNNFCILFFAAGMKGLDTWVVASEKSILFIGNENVKLVVQFEKVEEDKAQDKTMEKAEDKEYKTQDKEDKTEDKTQDKEDKTEDKTQGVRETLLQVIHDSVDKMKGRQTLKCENRSLQLLRNDNQDNEPDVGLQASQDEETQNSNRQERDPLETLFSVFITPVLQNLEQEEIVIIPDGPLYMVPFAALRDPNTGLFLSEFKRIRLAPSLATLKTLQECPAESHCKRGALVVGDPDVGEVILQGEKIMFPRLPKAKHEAEIIGTILNAKPLIESQATKENVKARLRKGVAIIHIAAHGSAENGNIALAPPTRTEGGSTPKEEDYMLTMQEVQEIGVKAQLVVLSCCHSGGGAIRSEGVVGMSRAFLAAGARAVVASLWAVDDEATFSFMLSFYTYLQQGESASKSLQQAMKELRKEGYDEPRHWAPFFVIGDDVSVYEKEEVKNVL